MSAKNHEFVRLLETAGLKFERWPIPKGEGGVPGRVPRVNTRWGFLLGSREEGREGDGTTSVHFCLNAAGGGREWHQRARCAVSVWNELKQLGMHLKGLRVEQGDPEELFSLVVAYGNPAERARREGDLVDFLIVLFVADRIDAILAEAQGIDKVTNSSRNRSISEVGLWNQPNRINDLSEKSPDTVAG